MKVVIVEDEIAASENLIFLLKELEPNLELLQVLDTVDAAVAYFSTTTDAQLVFMDIHLADGISFEIFERVSITVPIIFTTAYDQYALKAFKVNSIDYLLKPIMEEELEAALDKFKQRSSTTTIHTGQVDAILSLMRSQSVNYKTTYLVHHKDEMVPIKTKDIAFFYIDMGVVKAVTYANKPYAIEKKLEDIEAELDPAYFKRVNRQYVVQKEAIANLKYYFNGKLILQTNPPAKERIVISKAKATEFKSWVNR
ncbi:LytTR family DNA-binding domain-containing protein [Ulvibacterium sp.]|uniref:LytR/AlgR family response regulator transcription factor n=1 Tax=Ulvibacterium sp. TaxID=2665914 RepID=UPI00260D4EF3|nr:LytTR family DNA-binding domain-containing protein [Ulvibacterium sp.]